MRNADLAAFATGVMEWLQRVGKKRYRPIKRSPEMVEAKAAEFDELMERVKKVRAEAMKPKAKE